MGMPLNQRDWILLVNRKAHNGELQSDLADFTYPCGVDENCNPKICKESRFLKEGPMGDPDAVQVHHVVPMNDKRRCPWGANSNKNAAVISSKLNRYLWNKQPPADEVKLLNDAPAYTP
jgi:hypothetical protein